MNPFIAVHKVTQSHAATFDFNGYAFGNTATDHMLTAHFRKGRWEPPIIEPLQPLHLSPLAACLHYGQMVFEGMKAYRLRKDAISIFRLEKHGLRLNKSLQRMCMPEIPEQLFRESIHAFVETEQAWVPDLPGTTLYLRPFVLASQPRLGVQVAEEYRFVLVGAPMSAYYTGALKVKVETEYVRAVEGGAGYAKCAGNYGAALYPTQLAKAEGYDQVIWTDAKHHKFIEESGTMNVLFFIDGTVITPPLSGTILDGVTRESLLTLARDGGIPVEERPISIQELEAAFQSGKKIEAFGVGTAAVLTPMELIAINGKHYYPDVSHTSPICQLKKQLNAIRTGQERDAYGWNYIIEV